MFKASTRPVLRYHGGKFKLRQWIISHFPVHRVYVESFGGAASVLMGKERVYSEVYNDLDGEIVNVFRVLRDPIQSARLFELLTLTPFARDEFYLSYEVSEDPIEQARRTISRSYMGFGSDSSSRAQTGFRGYRNGHGRSTAADWSSYPKNVAGFCDRLAGVTIENRHALAVIAAHDDSEALHYIDPPYTHGTRKKTTLRKGKGYLFELSDYDHRELADLLKRVKGKVIISGYASDLYDRELYADWNRVERPHLADSAAPRTEVLWMNFHPTPAQPPQGTLTAGRDDPEPSEPQRTNL